MQKKPIEFSIRFERTTYPLPSCPSASPNRPDPYPATTRLNRGSVISGVTASKIASTSIPISRSSGAISAYHESDLPPGPRNDYRVVAQRGTIRGFVVLDHFARLGDATRDLDAWVDDGSIAWKADVQRGFENVPKALLRLYSGTNFGKQLLEV